MSEERKPLITLADVRLAAGELSQSEAVAVEWVIAKYEAMIDEWAEDLRHIDPHNPWRAAERIDELLKDMGR